MNDQRTALDTEIDLAFRHFNAEQERERLYMRDLDETRSWSYAPWPTVPQHKPKVPMPKMGSIAVCFVAWLGILAVLLKVMGVL